MGATVRLMGKPAVAVCEWLWRPSGRQPYAPLIEGRRNISECRASIGERIVTVWLPQGAVIRLRRARSCANPFSGTFRHVYGSEHTGWSRIDITLKPAPVEHP